MLCLITYKMFHSFTFSFFVFTSSHPLSFPLSHTHTRTHTQTHTHTHISSLLPSLLHLCAHTAPTTSTSTLGYSTSKHSRRSIEDDGYLNSNSGSRIRDKNSVLSFFLNRFKDTQPGTLILVRHGAYVHAYVLILMAHICPLSVRFIAARFFSFFLFLL